MEPGTNMTPPAIKTVLSGSSVALYPKRRVAIGPVVVNFPVSGSYNSAKFGADKSELYVSERRTLPSASSVAPQTSFEDVLPALVKERVAGSKSSASATPPVIKTLPLGSKVANGAL